MKRTVRETLISIGVAGAVAVVTSLLEGIVAADPVQHWAWVRDNILLLTILCGVLLAFEIFCLVVVENSLSENMWSRWRSNLKLVCELAVAATALSFGILLNDIVNFDPLEQWIKTYDPLSSILLLVALVTFALGLPVVRHIFRIYNRPGVQEERQVLQILKVRYQSHLDNSLIDIERFALNMKKEDTFVQPLPKTGTPLTIANPYDERGKADASEATEQALLSIYHKVQRRLLILAESGGGKSTQLYLMGKKLADGASADHEKDAHATVYFPVVLDLATCPDNNQKLENWLEDGIVRVYNIRRKAASDWVKSGQIVPLLDSLDILPTEKRRRIVRKINDYLIGPPDRPHTNWRLVVACSAKEYQEMGLDKLQLQYAVQLELLKNDLVEEILTYTALSYRSSGNTQKALRVEDLKHDLGDHKVMETLRIPLMMNVALMNLRTSVDAYLSGSGIKGLKSFLFDRYVEKTMQLPGRDPKRSAPPSAEEIDRMEKGLQWVGHALRILSLDIFYLRNLQRKLLPSDEAVGISSVCLQS